MSEIYKYYPKGTCSTEMIFELSGDTVEDLKVINGCNGNLKGIARLIQGMKIDDVIEKLEGTTCGFKKTSCPDQIAQGLKKYRQEKA